MAKTDKKEERNEIVQDEKPEAKPAKPEPPKPKPAEKEKLAPFEVWANEKYLKPWQIAGIREMYSIKPGKQISKKAFDEMLEGFSKKPIGG